MKKLDPESRSALPMALTIASAAALSLLGFIALIRSEPLCYDEPSC